MISQSEQQHVGLSNSTQRGRSGTGEVFGELALMGGAAVPRKATARCLDESELLFVSAEGFEEVKKYVARHVGYPRWLPSREIVGRERERERCQDWAMRTKNLNDLLKAENRNM